MKHLFIINPSVKKVKDRIKPIIADIDAFFKQYSQMKYDIHITRWARDASGYVRRYAMASEELLRVHVIGGSGTLFEVINGAIGLPNVQIAAYPYGRCNSFLRYFGKDKTHMFSSVRNQVFSGVTAIDAVRCGRIFGISHGLIGLQADASREGKELQEKINAFDDFCYKYSIFKAFWNRKATQTYRVTLDGEVLDGNCITMQIANGPCYGKDLAPAVDAHPNDGLLDIYLVKHIKPSEALSAIQIYASGNYRKLPEKISHHRGSKIIVSSDDIMSVSVDGETFFENSIEYEVMPYAIDFVCPDGIDVGKLPRVYGQSEE